MNPITGGPPNGINYITPYLNELNVETTILCLDNPNDDFIKNSTFKIIALGQNKGAWQYNPDLYNWLTKNLLHFDAVIVHGIWIYHTYAVAKAIRKLMTNCKTKMYIMPHGMLDSYFQTAKKRWLKSIRNLFYWHLIEHKNIQTANALLFTSKAEMEIASKTFKNYAPKQTLNLGYGIDVSNKINNKTNNYKSYYLFLGRYHEKKGIDLLIKAYSKLLTTQLTELSDLIIAGPGLKSEYGKFISNLVNENNLLKNKITLLDMVEGKSKWELITNAKAMILWSHQENFGITVAEALGFGVPVLLSNKVNIWQEITENNAGFSGNDNEADLANTLAKLNRLSENEYLLMQQNAKLVYNKFFKPQAYAERLQLLLNKN